MISRIMFIAFTFLANAQFVTAQQRVATKGVIRKGVSVQQPAAVKRTTYDILAFEGKWQEAKRMVAATKETLDFTDSLQLNFNKRDSVIVRQGMMMGQKGNAFIEGENELQVAGDLYIILSLSENILVLSDGDVIHELHKKKFFYHETLGTLVVKKENLTSPQSINVKKVSGKWNVYRTQAVPGAATDSAIIKSLNFTHIKEEGTASGEVTFVQAGTTSTLPVNAIFSKGTLQLRTTDYTWNLETYKADGKEFVFGQKGGLVYFSKQL